MAIQRHHLASPSELPDQAERLSADDQATQREAEFLAAARAQVQRQTAAAALRRTPGVCTFCGARCLPLAVYCDDDCRRDHEAEQLVLRRQGRA